MLSRAGFDVFSLCFLFPSVSFLSSFDAVEKDQGGDLPNLNLDQFKLSTF